MPNIWRLGQVKDTRFDTNPFSKMLLNVVKCQGYSFYRFRVIEGKPTEREELFKITPSHPDVKCCLIAADIRRRFKVYKTSIRRQ